MGSRAEGDHPIEVVDSGAGCLVRAGGAPTGAPAAAWAGFVLIGDAATVPMPGGRPASPWMPAAVLGIAAVAAAAGLVLRRVLRRRRTAGADPGVHGP